MLALMLYTYLKGEGISHSIECGLLFHYWISGVWRCLSVNNKQLTRTFLCLHKWFWLAGRKCGTTDFIY